MSSIRDQDIIDAAAATFDVKCQEVFEKDSEGGFIDAIAETVETESETNEVDLLGAMPVLRKWLGPKEEQFQRAYKLSATLAPYEATFSLPRPKVRYDKTGLIGRRIDRFLGRNRYWKEKIVFDNLVTNPTGYDGVSFFSTSHPHGPSAGTQSNKTTSALSPSTLNTAVLTMESLRDENGESLEVSPKLLVVGPKLRKTATELTGSTRLQLADATGGLDVTSSGLAAAAVPTYFGGFLNVMIWPRFVGTYDDYWMCFDTEHAAKAWLLYEGRAVEGIQQTDMSGEFRFINDKLRWSLESDHAPVPAAWQVAYAGIL